MCCEFLSLARHEYCTHEAIEAMITYLPKGKPANGLAQTGRGSQSPLLIEGLLEINSCWGRIILF